MYQFALMMPRDHSCWKSNRVFFWPDGEKLNNPVDQQKHSLKVKVNCLFLEMCMRLKHRDVRSYLKVEMFLIISRCLYFIQIVREKNGTAFDGLDGSKSYCRVTKIISSFLQTILIGAIPDWLIELARLREGGYIETAFTNFY